MIVDPAQISGIGEFTQDSPTKTAQIFRAPNDKVFLVLHPNTLEVRTDAQLSKLLISEYESVMQSRYFGVGGIEIVPSGQLSDAEIEDLVRLSYNLSVSTE